MTDDRQIELGDLTELYLPQRFWGAVEARILTASPSLVGEIVPPEDINANGLHRAPLAGVDVCARNLTHGLTLGQPFYFCVTRSTAFNAMVAKFGSFYCIVLSEGLYQYLYVAMAALLSHEPLAKFLESGEEPADDLQPALRSRREAWAHILARSSSLTSDRSFGLASVPTLLGMYFLTAHEIGHVVLGHLSSNRDSHAVEEGSSLSADHAMSRTLERDADAFAAAATVWYTGAEEVRDRWRSVLNDKQAGLRLLFTASYVLFSIMDLHSDSEDIIQQSTHPAPMVRISSMGMLLSGVMACWGAYTLDEVWEAGRQCVRAVEIATMALGQGMMTASEAAALQQEAERAIQSHFRNMAHAWEKLDRNQLDAYFWAAPFKEFGSMK